MKFNVGDIVEFDIDKVEDLHGLMVSKSHHDAGTGTVVSIESEQDLYFQVEVKVAGALNGHNGSSGVKDITDRWVFDASELRKVYTKKTKSKSVALENGGTGSVLPVEADKRKQVPLMTGLVDYFSAALAAVAEVSKAGNEQHNPGQPLHWDRSKSTDHADCAMRHLTDRGTIDNDGKRHTAKAAWRVLALLQEELEAAGAPKARGAK